MDAFEQVVKTVLEGEGWWVQQGFKVELTKEEKVKVDRPSSPRWEIDLVAYKPGSNQIMAVECKSYLDSFGVRAKDLVDSEVRTTSYYKLFIEANLRSVVLSRLKEQLVHMGLALDNSSVTLALAAGKFWSPTDRAQLHERFQERGWRLIDDIEIRKGVLGLASRGYEDNVATIIAKLMSSQPPKGI